MRVVCIDVRDLKPFRLSISSDLSLDFFGRLFLPTHGKLNNDQLGACAGSKITDARQRSCRTAARCGLLHRLTIIRSPPRTLLIYDRCSGKYSRLTEGLIKRNIASLLHQLDN